MEDISGENQAKHEWQFYGGKEHKNLTQDGRVSRSAQPPHIGTPMCAGRGFRLDVGELG